MRFYVYFLLYTRSIPKYSKNNFEYLISFIFTFQTGRFSRGDPLLTVFNWSQWSQQTGQIDLTKKDLIDFSIKALSPFPFSTAATCLYI